MTKEGRAFLNSPAEYGTDARQFRLSFGKRDDQTAYFYKANTNLIWISSIRGVKFGSVIDFTSAHIQSDYRELMIGEVFFAKNVTGYIMQGRVIDIRLRRNDGPGEDVLIFNYQIDPGKAAVTVTV